jgi:hypothetical protein
VRLPPGTAAAHAFERSYRWAAPHVFSELGRQDEAKAAFEMLIAEGFGGLPPDNGHNARIPVLMGLSEACITAADERAAGEIYDLLAQYSDQWFCVGWGSVVFASTHLMLGGLRGVQRRWDEATEHFEEAMRQHDAESAACAQARTLYQWARMLVRRGSRSDAAMLIDRALDICGAFGLAGAQRRLLRLRAT